MGMAAATFSGVWPTAAIEALNPALDPAVDEDHKRLHAGRTFGPIQPPLRPVEALLPKTRDKQKIFPGDSVAVEEQLLRSPSHRDRSEAAAEKKQHFNLLHQPAKKGFSLHKGRAAAADATDLLPRLHILQTNTRHAAAIPFLQCQVQGFLQS